MPFRRLIFEWLAVLAMAATSIFAMASTSIGQRASNRVLDWAISLNPPVPDDRIVIVEIDDGSLASLGNWPWNRRLHAAQINLLSSSKPTLIAYDVLFNEPADGDDALAEAIARSGSVILPAYVQSPGSNGADFDLVEPVSNIRNATKGIGHVNVVFDEDGLVRRASLGALGSGSGPQHMMAKAFTSMTKTMPKLPAEMVIPFNPVGSFPRLPFNAVLKGEVPPSFFKGKVILVGASAQGMGDNLSVPGPAGSIMPGVEVQANILNALLADASIQSVPNVMVWVISILVVLGTMLAFWKLRPTAGLLIAVLFGSGAMVCSAVLLAATGTWLTPLPLVCGLLLAYPLWSWRRLAALNRFVETEASTLNLALGKQATTRLDGLGLDAVALSASRMKQVVGQLHDLKSFMAGVIQAAPDALSVVDPKGEVILSNMAADALFGQPSEGRVVSDLITTIAPNANVNADELELPDGRTFLSKTVQIAQRDAVSTGSILRLADITDRRNAEREREEMLEFLSHDMRSPQAAIIALLDLSEADPTKPLPLPKVREHAQTALKLADDFVQLAKLDAVTPQIEPIDLCSILTEAIDRAYQFAQEKDVSFKYETECEDHYVSADAWSLMRAMNNLLDNAIKYSPEHGQIRCTIRKEVGEAAQQTYHICEISDQGPGIPSDRLPVLFQRFGPNDKRAKLSAGLGLAYVKKAMDQMNAEIECKSSASGASFLLKFLALPDEEA